MLLANNYSEAFNTKGSNQHNDLVTQIKSNLDLGCWDKVFTEINCAIPPLFLDSKFLTWSEANAIFLCSMYCSSYSTLLTIFSAESFVQR